MEHRPWVGSDYEVGLNGQRIAIVGYSHHHDTYEIDGEDFTEETVKDVISGKLKGDALFSRVRGYFDYTDSAAFGTEPCSSTIYQNASARRTKDMIVGQKN